MSNSNDASNKTNTYELASRIARTLLVVAIYCLIRTISITFIDQTAMGSSEIDASTILVSMLSGDRGQFSVVALGVMPYMFGSIIVMFGSALRSQEARRRTSPRTTRRLTVILSLIIATAMAIGHVDQLIFENAGLPFTVMRIIAILEMIAGAMLIVAMIEMNKKHGIGQMTPIIMVNVIDSLITSVSGVSLVEITNPLLISIVTVAVALAMEFAVMKIPVQRVSIKNNYAESNYIGFKLNPTGVMPVMFSTLMFMIPQLIVMGALLIWPGNETLIFLNNNLLYTAKLGVIVYMFIIVLTAICFSFLLLSPGDLAENLQKGGDSIVEVYAGPKTARYLRLRLLLLSLSSGFVMAVLMGLSLALSLGGTISVDLAMLPSSAMILASFICTLGQEIVAYRRYDSYKTFL